MKRFFFVLVLSLAFLAFSASVMASGIAPSVVQFPNSSNKAVALGVENIQGDKSWMHIPFDTVYFLD